MTIKQLEKEVKKLQEIESKNNKAKFRIEEIGKELNGWHNKYERATKEKKEKLIKRKEYILEVRETLEKELLSLEYNFLELRKLEGELYKRIEVKKAKEIIKNSDKLELFKIISKKTVSKSPFSDSTYFHRKNQSIDWGTKPENSYRLADHWNWKQGFNEDYTDAIHCPLKDGKHSSERMICIQKNGAYEILAILTKEEYEAIQRLVNYSK